MQRQKQTESINSKKWLTSSNRYKYITSTRPKKKSCICVLIRFFMNYYFRRKVARVWHFSMTRLRMSMSLMIRSKRIPSMSQRIRTKIFRCLNTKMNFQIQVHYLDRCTFNLSYMQEWSVCLLRLVLVRSLKLSTHYFVPRNWMGLFRTVQFMASQQRQWMEGCPLRQITCKWLTSSTYVCK